MLEALPRCFQAKDLFYTVVAPHERLTLRLGKKSYKKSELHHWQSRKLQVIVNHLRRAVLLSFNA